MFWFIQDIEIMLGSFETSWMIGHVHHHPGQRDHAPAFGTVLDGMVSIAMLGIVDMLVCYSKTCPK
jgi:hypothetical protein